MIIVGFMGIKYNEARINYNKKTMKVDKIFQCKYNVMWTNFYPKADNVEEMYVYYYCGLRKCRADSYTAA